MFWVKVVLVYSHPLALFCRWDDNGHGTHMAPTPLSYSLALLTLFCRWDDNGHGTHAAGTAAGSIHGVAQNAIVHAVKVRGRNEAFLYVPSWGRRNLAVDRSRGIDLRLSQWLGLPCHNGWPYGCVPATTTRFMPAALPFLFVRFLTLQVAEATPTSSRAWAGEKLLDL